MGYETGPASQRSSRRGTLSAMDFGKPIKLGSLQLHGDGVPGSGDTRVGFY